VEQSFCSDRKCIRRRFLYYEVSIVIRNFRRADGDDIADREPVVRIDNCDGVEVEWEQGHGDTVDDPFAEGAQLTSAGFYRRSCGCQTSIECELIL